MISLNISKKIHTQEGVTDFNINKTFNEGEFITISGSSGTGKTTLLRMIAGLTEPDTGVIKVGEEIWFDSSGKVNLSIQKRKCGFIFQETTLFPHMSVLQNILYANKNKKQAYELLELLEISALEERLPAKLSGGQKQRVAIARALAINPRILLLDEPFSSLDMNLKSVVQNELKSIHKKFGTLIILVTHDYTDIFSLSTRTIFLTPGRIEKDGTPHEVYLENRTKNDSSIPGKILSIEKKDSKPACIISTQNGIIESIIKDSTAENIKIGDMVLISKDQCFTELTKLKIKLHP